MESGKKWSHFRTKKRNMSHAKKFIKKVTSEKKFNVRNFTHPNYTETKLNTRRKWSKKKIEIISFRWTISSPKFDVQDSEHISCNYYEFFSFLFFKNIKYM